MASGSSTAQFSLKKMSSISDHSPPPFPTESSGSTCNPNTPRPSCSYALPHSPSNSPSIPSTPKLSRIEYLDEKIKLLLQEKMIHKVVHGRTSDTLQLHRRNILNEIAIWLRVIDFQEIHDVYREELLKLLASASRQLVKDIPIDDTEWTKLLNIWIRQNCSGLFISKRDIFRILAVDGFRGFRPKELKQYLSQVLLPLRAEYKAHVHGVRAMYEFFEEKPSVRSITGTDSACVIYWALLELYSHHLPEELVDDQMCFRVAEAKSRAEGFLFQNTDYYRDVQNVDIELLQELGNVYTKQFTEEKEWKTVGREFLKCLI